MQQMCQHVYSRFCKIFWTSFFYISALFFSANCQNTHINLTLLLVDLARSTYYNHLILHWKYELWIKFLPLTALEEKGHIKYSLFWVVIVHCHASESGQELHALRSRNFTTTMYSKSVPLGPALPGLGPFHLDRTPVLLVTTWSMVGCKAFTHILLSACVESEGKTKKNGFSPWGA